MAERKAYWELLKDPRWQRKRLEIMQRNEFRCEWCYAGEEVTLNVHHTYYERDAAPWEYPNSSLLCLCDDCHKKAHVIWEEMKRLTSLLTTTRFAPELERVIGYAKAVIADNERCYDRPDPIEYTVEESMGIGDFFGFSGHHVADGLGPFKSTASAMWNVANPDGGGVGYRFPENWKRLFASQEGSGQ